jgi:hypothetical protein
MRSLVLLVSLLGLLAGKGFARSNEEERLEKTPTVIGEILDIPDGMPQELLDKSKRLLVLPSVKKVAIGIGGATAMERSASLRTRFGEGQTSRGEVESRETAIFL